MESQSSTPQVGYYQMVMECLAATGQIVAGFALLARVEASGLTSGADENCYKIFHTLCEACCMVGDFAAASWVDARLQQLDLTYFATAAGATMTAKGHTSLRSFVQSSAQ
eukprot:gnl/TRDRNA2_/TRDRNA2_175704_c3_seq2.p1 gnl/TRDRNA2_/TRDRNA2_175704_c3~~gnl/TRDRNA2_/TRDRNA2_175704_c3_seq2.p1  ORF type:complete len:121 (-),score=22.72 gnl/TRDRNA2_/TRDRNA2_175704_c3_seq2:104-433(-)